MGQLRRLLWAFAAIAVIGVIIVLIVPLIISAEDVRNKLFAEIEDATGYRLRVSGPIGISVFPSLSLAAEDVGVAQSGTGEGVEIATARKLRLGLALSSLLGGQVRMTEIALVDPVIRMPAATPPSEDGADASGASSASALKTLSLDSLVIENGTVILPGGGEREGKHVTGVMLEASLSDFDGPLTFDLDSIYDGQPLNLAGSIDGLGPFLGGGAVPVSLTIGAPAYLAQDVALTGTASYTGKSFTITDFAAQAGDSVLSGSIAGNLSADIPRVKGALNGETLDLDALLPQHGEASASASADEAIDFSPLDSVVADLTLSIRKVIVSGVAITPLVAALRVGEGKLTVVADQIGAGSASGSGSVVLDAHQDPPYVGGRVRLAGVDLATAGKLGGSDLPVTGVAGADVAFASVGRTLAEFKERINASGSLTLQDGAATVAGLGAIVGDPKADRIGGIDIKASFEDLLKPVSVTGAATWRGERFSLNAAGAVQGILAGKPAAIEAKATAKRVSLGFKGSASAKGVGAGNIWLQTPSLTNLLVWLGQQPGWQSGFGPFAVNGKLAFAANSISFENTAFQLDNTRGAGNGKITLGQKPNVEAQFALETLDVNPYLGAGGAPSAGRGAAGWSDAKIDFSSLNAIDAKVSLTAKELIYREIKTGAVGIKATIAGGKLDAELPDLKLYKGSGSGALSVDASGKTPTQAFRFTLSGLDAYPFLSDAAGFRNIEGTGEIAVEVTGSGSSQRAIVSTLNGTANFKFTDGAIRGVNIAKLVRSLTSGTLSGWQSSEAEKTDFASLGASFKVAQGQASSDDLQLVGPLVRMSGSGTVDMPAQTLRFRVNPQVVASLEGQGGKTDMQGLGVPVMVAGPWSKPSIYPDVAGILQNPSAAYEQLRQLGGGLFKLPAAGEAVGSVGGIPDLVQDGKINKDALRKGAIDSLGQILGVKQPADRVPAEVPPEQANMPPEQLPPEQMPPPEAPPAEAGAPADFEAEQSPEVAPAEADDPEQSQPKQKHKADQDNQDKKKGKNKKAKKDGDRDDDAKAAAEQLLQNLLGSQ